MPKVILAGGSGFLGASCAEFLANAGYDIVVLTRRPKLNTPRVRFLGWDGKSLGDWADEFDGAAAVINFTGKNVACLYTPENRAEIVASRIDSVRAVAAAIARAKAPPEVLIQAASLAIYGDTREVCTEGAPHGTGFSVEVCEAWEEAFFRTAPEGVRWVLARIGFVLGPGGGALEPLTNLTRCFLGGTVGTGRQYISWLHIDDLNRLLLRAMIDDTMKGIYNATGPTPLENRSFMKTLRAVLKRPWSPRAPEFLVKFGARHIMLTDPSLALTGRNCVPHRLLKEGFSFNHTHLEPALREILIAPRNRFR